jgi:hypothetical protein
MSLAFSCVFLVFIAEWFSWEGQLDRLYFFRFYWYRLCLTHDSCLRNLDCELNWISLDNDRLRCRFGQIILKQLLVSLTKLRTS